MYEFDLDVAIKDFLTGNGNILIEHIKVIVKWNYVYDFLTLIDKLKIVVSEKHEDDLIKLHDVVKHKVSYSTITGYSNYTVYHFKKDLEKIMINFYTSELNLLDSEIRTICTFYRCFENVLADVKSFFRVIQLWSIYAIKSYIANNFSYSNCKFFLFELIYFSDNIYKEKIVSTIINNYEIIIEYCTEYNKYKLFVMTVKIIQKYKKIYSLQELFLNCIFLSKIDPEIMEFILKNFSIDINYEIKSKMKTTIHYGHLTHQGVKRCYEILDINKSREHLNLLKRGYTVVDISGTLTKS